MLALRGNVGFGPAVLEGLRALGLKDEEIRNYITSQTLLLKSVSG